MNFARLICDRRAAQSVMRNIAFALQARNQRARIRIQSFADTALRDDDQSVCVEYAVRAISGATSIEIASTRIASRIDPG
jgi:hypothetical protein